MKITTKKEYDNALRRIEVGLGKTDPDTPEGRELHRLIDAVEAYEDEHFPMGMPDPVSAIKFRMEQEGLAPRDLIPYMGSREAVSMVLSGKRKLTLDMIRNLHKHLDISLEILIQEPAGEEPKGMDWNRFPLRAMIKEKWIPASELKNPKAAMMGMISRAGGEGAIPSALMFRKNDGIRKNAELDRYALIAWCLRVLERAREKKIPKAARIDQALLERAAKLSFYTDGPLRAVDYLTEYGVRVVHVPHLPKTHLDGAAICLPDGSPVIGLTLRYDRLDSFWFCLLHELAHLCLHMKGDEIFADDITIRDTAKSRQDRIEREADAMALAALIPANEWENQREYLTTTPRIAKTVEMAKRWGISPAIVAGRIRHDTRNYKALTALVGFGEVRKYFMERR